MELLFLLYFIASWICVVVSVIVIPCSLCVLIYVSVCIVCSYLCVYRPSWSGGMIMA